MHSIKVFLSHIFQMKLSLFVLVALEATAVSGSYLGTIASMGRTAYRKISSVANYFVTDESKKPVFLATFSSLL